MPSEIVLTKKDARAIVAWINLCAEYRNYAHLRCSSDGSEEAEKFLARHPTIATAMATLTKIAKEGPE